MKNNIINEAGVDYLYFTEILNDLNQRGFIKGGKAEQMIIDFREEHRWKMNFAKTNAKKRHAEYVGSTLWNN